MKDDRAGERGERVRRVVVRLAVVNDHGQSQLVGELEVCLEQLALLLARREAPDGVEARLSDRDGLGMA